MMTLKPFKSLRSFSALFVLLFLYGSFPAQRPSGDCCGQEHYYRRHQGFLQGPAEDSAYVCGIFGCRIRG